MDAAALDKPTLRRILSARRDALTPRERAEMEAGILARLLALPAFRDAPVVCGYVSTRGEIDTSPLWRATVAAGKTYALPVTVSDAAHGRMIFRATRDYCPDRLVRGRFGIPEPPDAPDFPEVTPAELAGALILVPGLGFDRDGYRIGYGGGYYDRFLAALTAARIPVTTVGLCPAVCLADRLPREAHDRAVDTVLSAP